MSKFVIFHYVYNASSQDALTRLCESAGSSESRLLVVARGTKISCIVHLPLISYHVMLFCTLTHQLGPEAQYHKTCLKQLLKNRQRKVLKSSCSLMKIESIAECSLEAVRYTFDLH